MPFVDAPLCGCVARSRALTRHLICGASVSHGGVGWFRLSLQPRQDMMVAFRKFFMPAWNAGQLDETYYKDKYEFECSSVWWTQTWDNNVKQFVFTNSITKETQFENPMKFQTMRKPLLAACAQPTYS